MAHDPVAEIRERLDIVDLIQQYVPSLKRTGNTFKGLCPFHGEKTPSFIVYPDSQTYYCFGCNKHGDIYSFYMAMENVEFRQALTELGQRAGVEISTSAPKPPEEEERRKKLIEVNELAATWFNHILLNASQGEEGRKIIESRGVSPESVQTWKLGFAPDSWDALLNFMASRNYAADLVEEAGLATGRDSGGFYDRFRNRLMFPIRDRDGQTVGFGGRALGDAQPKYLNTAQTPIFDKSSLVYGMDLARDAIRESNQVVIVEGYMDAIATHQAGYRNVVASMGTALTESQVAQIKRGSPNIVLALDADSAGQAAALRGLQTMTEHLDADAVPSFSASRIIGWERKLKADIRIVQLDGGKDPDDIIRSDPAAWPRIISQAVPFMDFVITMVTKDVDLTDAKAKSAAVREALPLLRQLPDAITENHYARLLARKLDLPETAIAEAKRSMKLESRRSVREPDAAPPQRRHTAEDYLMALLIQHHQINYPVLDRLDGDDLVDPRNRELLDFLKKPETAELEGEQIVIGLPDDLADHAEQLLASLQQRAKLMASDVLLETDQAANRIQRDRHQTLVALVQAELAEARKAGDTALISELMQRYQRLIERRRSFEPGQSSYFRDLRSGKLPG